MIAYHRGVLKFLRDTYGVRAHIQHGGRHPYLEFEYGGKLRWVTLSKSPGDRRALANAEHDIRRMLEPLHTQSLTEAIMDELEQEFVIDKSKWTGPDSVTMPDEVEDEPRDITGRGWVACYDSNRVLLFCFGDDVKDCLSMDTRYAVVAHGDHPSAGWEIRPGEKLARARIIQMGKSWKMNFGAGKLPAFRRCAADYTVVDGHVLVSIVAGENIVLMSSVRPPVVEHREPIPFPAPRPRPSVVPAPPRITPPPPKPTPAPSVPAMSGTFLLDPPHHAQLRAILKGIINAEDHGWELVKTDAGWRWRAEVGPER